MDERYVRKKKKEKIMTRKNKVKNKSKQEPY
jgi:hypothetical protein